jgi:catechol 2,3-dioxygenase-like lactoylglutathione lyase family enzyme
MRFDHLMHWVPNLDVAVAECTARGFPPRIWGRIGESALHNAGWNARDGNYLELISVYDWEAWRNRKRGSGASAREAALAAGGALQFAFEVNDMPSTVAAVRDRGIEITDPSVGTIEQPGGAIGRRENAWVIEGPGWRPFNIKYPRPRAERLANRTAVPDWAFHSLDLSTPDPGASAAWLRRVLGIPAASNHDVDAFGCTIHFVPGEVDRITRIVLDGTEGPIGDVFGVRYERLG